MNLKEYFEVAVQRAPQAIALVDQEIRWTYEELAREVNSCARNFWSLGLRAGDRIMVLLRNRREHIVIFWASQLLGLVYVPVSYRFSANDIAYCIEDAEPEMLVFDEASATIIHHLAVRAALPGSVYAVGETSTTFARLPLCVAKDAAVLPSIAIADEAIAVMLYSSGVTGVPKGIPRSHTNEVSATMAHIVQNGYQFGESTLALSPFSHTMGLRSLLAMVLLNGKLVLTGEEAIDQLALIEQERISCLYAFPGVYHALVESAAQYDVSSVQRLAYAGDSMSPHLIKRCQEVFHPTTFINHFGSTEIYTYSICSWLDRKPGCAGKAGLHSELRIVVAGDTADASGVAATRPHEVVPPGEIGELIVKLTSPEAFRGYWNRPDLTTRSIRHGWYFTGDLARLDEDNDLWVMGRVDDMVISNGEKVYPSEVEAVLREHPGVKEVVVAGIPDARVGKLLTAFVVPRDPALTEQDLMDFCRANDALADFKRPAKFLLVEHMPRQASKILRRELVGWKP
jgi:2-furoate---CoA ligase